MKSKFLTDGKVLLRTLCLVVRFCVICDMNWLKHSSVLYTCLEFVGRFILCLTESHLLKTPGFSGNLILASLGGRWDAEKLLADKLSES